jgi:hypothetical protein
MALRMAAPAATNPALRTLRLLKSGGIPASAKTVNPGTIQVPILIRYVELRTIPDKQYANGSAHEIGVRTKS